MSKLFHNYCGHNSYKLQKEQKKEKKKEQALNEPRWSVRAHQHMTMRAEEGEQKKVKREKRGGATNLQGLASNTIWRETIQFARTRGRGRRGRGTDERQGQKEVKGHRQRMESTPADHSERFTTQFFWHWIKWDYFFDAVFVWEQKASRYLPWEPCGGTKWFDKHRIQ